MHMNIYFKLFIILIIMQSKTVNASSNENLENPLHIPQVKSGIHIDAKLDEPQWEDALLVNANIEVQPGENISAPVQTQALLMYDKDYVYVGFICQDPSPQDIRAHFCDRDKIFSDDWVMVLFDTFNDNQRSTNFYCNPFGIQGDLIKDATGNTISWEGIWDSHGRITSDGYIVEMAIPFSSLGFQQTSEEQVWGFDIVRNYPRNVRHYFGSFPRDRSNNCYLCQALKLKGFQNVKPGRDFEIAPTLSSIHSSTRQDGYGSHMITDQQDIDAGVSARLGLTPNIALNGALNPDFSQVEADNKHLDINRQYAINYAEKRPFFLESGDYFKTYTSAVYTRSIADPDFGIKLTGKEGPHTVGFFSLRDKITNLIIPGEQSSQSGTIFKENTNTALRYKYDYNTSNVGIILTDREGDNYHNRLGGIDGLLRFTPQDQFRFQVLNSTTQYPDSISAAFEQNPGKINGSALSVSHYHETRNYMLYGLYRQFAPGYRADLGFITQAGIRYQELGGMLKWQREPGSWFTVLNWYASHDIKRDWMYMPLHSAWTSRIIYKGPYQTEITIYGESANDYYKGKQYPMNLINFWTLMRPTSLFIFELQCKYGDQIDYSNERPGTRMLLIAETTFKPGNHFSLEWEQKYEYLDVQPGRLYSAHISNIKLVYQFSKRMFIRSILQYYYYKRNSSLYIDDDVKSIDKYFFTQLLFSYKINPQTALYLGYTDNYTGNNMDPLYETDRVFFCKIGYAWRL